MNGPSETEVLSGRAMSPPVERFGLRFAAAALPEGEGPTRLRAEGRGRVAETRPQPIPPLRSL